MRVTTVGDVSEQVRGVSYVKSEASDVLQPGYSPILRANNISENGLLLDALVFVPDAKISQKQRIAPNDVIVAASSGSLSVVGKTAQAREGFEGGFGAFCKVLRPRPAVDPHYFGHYFRTSLYRHVISRLAAGANINNLRNEHLDNLQIPFPPLDQQKRIAGILDAADALRVKRREALAQLDTLLQSTFLDMFGELTGNGWEMVTVEDVARNKNNAIRTGPFGSQLLHSEFVSEGIRVLGIDNTVANVFRKGEPRFITPQKYELLRRFTVRPGDVLITIMGTCGRCAVVSEDVGVAINTKHLCCITLDREKCLPGFMHAYFLEHPLAHRYLERSAKGAIMAGLNMGIIKALPIPVPPLDLQHRFAAIVESAEQQKTRQRAHLAELDTLFASLQSRAFRGDL